MCIHSLTRCQGEKSSLFIQRGVETKTGNGRGEEEGGEEQGRLNVVRGLQERSGQEAGAAWPATPVHVQVVWASFFLPAFHLKKGQ